MTAPRRLFASAAARLSLLALLAALALPAPARAAAPQPGPPLTIKRVTGPIALDGNLDDAGWKDVTPVSQWFETKVNDSTEPPVANLAYLAYDEKFLYAGFKFDDPNPKLIRAPLGDHDNLSGYTDYGGVIVDSRNDARTAQLFLANANGLQYDALTSDVSGEDSAPDYYWEAAGKVTESGWNLELRIPFTSMRYSDPANPTFGLLLYRNYPRERHYQFFTARLPRDVNCFICNSSKLTGLQNLPRGSHLVVAPYATAQRNDEPEDGPGSPLGNSELHTDAGLDIKWSPLSTAAVDATFNPDFSQVESDAAQIGANERFALFYPEKRSFFLEGVDLFSTPFQAVYTRTVTSPSVGLRMTGRAGKTAYTALAAHDRGGGSVILPGPQGSDLIEQDFRSDVGIVRVRHELGRQSFLSALGTTRELDGGGFNRVFGPDFQWYFTPNDNLTGQALWSESRTPDRTDLVSDCDGRSLSDRALLLYYSHGDARYDVFAQGQDIGEDFRADDGFMPKVGYREGYFEAGRTWRPTTSFFSRIRLFTADYVDVNDGGDVLARRFSIGTGMDGKLSSFLRVELNRDEIRVGDALLGRFRPRVQIQASPGRLVNSVVVDTYFGQEIDFANGREGTGASVSTSVNVRPTPHLELGNTANVRWLNVDAGARSGRLFVAWVERLKATYMFNSRCFVRVIGQYVTTRRDLSLYTFTGPQQKDEDFGSSALFAYKINWQTVLYAGYGDDRTFTDATGRLEPIARQVFAKVSYALQK